MLGVGCGACKQSTSPLWGRFAGGLQFECKLFLPLPGWVNQLPHYFPHNAVVIAFRSDPGTFASEAHVLRKMKLSLNGGNHSFTKGRGWF